jgi:hypothetical protein
MTERQTRTSGDDPVIALSLSACALSADYRRKRQTPMPANGCFILGKTT